MLFKLGAFEYLRFMPLHNSATVNAIIWNACELSLAAASQSPFLFFSSPRKAENRNYLDDDDELEIHFSLQMLGNQ